MKIARIDINQKDIVKYLRERNVTVAHMHMIGGGFPDIVCGYKGKNFLFEIKNPDQPPSARKLTAAETIFHFEWRGQVDIIETGEQAWQIIQAATKG